MPGTRRSASLGHPHSGSGQSTEIKYLALRARPADMNIIGLQLCSHSCSCERAMMRVGIDQWTASYCSAVQIAVNHTRFDTTWAWTIDALLFWTTIVYWSSFKVTQNHRSATIIRLGLRMDQPVKVSGVGYSKLGSMCTWATTTKIPYSAFRIVRPCRHTFE